MNQKSKFEKIKGYAPIITTRNYIEGLKDEITQAEYQANRSNTEKNEAVGERDKLKKEIESINETHTKEIKKLENELSSKNESLEISLKSNETNSLKIANLNEEIIILQRKNKNINQDKEELVEENNNLKSKLEEATQIIVDLKNKNSVQASKIKEFSKKSKHLPLEYKEDGLPKQTKETLLKRKISKKKENKKEGKIK